MQKRKGQVLVETALILPLLLLLILGGIDFGRALYAKNSINNAARSGARVAAITPGQTPEPDALLSSSASIPATAVKNSLLNLDQSSITYELKILDPATGTPVLGTAQPGDVVRVTVRWPNFPMITPFSWIGSLFSGSPPQDSSSVSLTGEASMRYE